MAEATTIFFVVQFIIFMACFLYKVYSVVSYDNPPELKYKIMSLIIGLMAYGVGLFTILADFSVRTYLIMYRFETLFLGVFIIFFIIELFVAYKQSVVNVSRERYSPSRED